MTKISTIGLDLAKNVFQVHGVDASGAVVLGRQLRRAAVEKFFARLPPCLVGMEACGSAHQWARVISRYGHEVRLMPPAYVKAYVKRNKTDGRDAGIAGSATYDDRERAAGGAERTRDRGGTGIRGFARADGQAPRSER